MEAGSLHAPPVTPCGRITFPAPNSARVQLLRECCSVRIADAVADADSLEVTCPCCAATIVVDRHSGEVLWHRERQERGGKRSLEEMVRGLDAQKDETARRLEKELENQKDRSRLLEARFREAVARADKSSKKPVNPFDLD